MSEASYPLFCPVAMAADLLEPRWTLLILCELWAGSRRFNDIHRGVPGMSPTLLARRLREMQARGLVRRSATGRGGPPGYAPTEMAEELEPIVAALGAWAHRNIRPEIALADLDDRVLMWNVRRKIDTLALPVPRCVIRFALTDPAGARSRYWMVIRPGRAPDLCYVDKGFDVDLYVEATLRAFTAAWIGHSSFGAEIAAGRIALIGHRGLADTLEGWLVRSSFAASGEAGAAGLPPRPAPAPQCGQGRPVS
ncbi:winged helix-turn-helix transcriptional regulator [Roseivivax sp. CAU 1761]